MARAAPPDLSDTQVPLRGLARSYPRGLYIEPHEHEWGQVLYAMSGLMWLETPQEALLLPPQRAVWLPPGVPHGIRVISELQMRNIYLRPSLAGGLEEHVQVFEVDALLRELILRLVEQEKQPDPEYYRALSDLCVLELRRAPQQPAAHPAAGGRRPPPARPVPGGAGQPQRGNPLRTARRRHRR